MPGRRLSDRRRRVMYSHGQSERAPTRSRGETQQLREARNPQATYGARVQRRLDGKWYSLVPVRRKSMTAVAATLVAISLALIALHVAAVAIPSIADRPQLARGMRLDQPESLGTWWRSILGFLAAGSALLIYQLRRYRLDDYSGQYRLWRAVFWATLLISIESSAGVISMAGAWIEFLFGSRIGLSGADWIRMLVTVALFLYGVRVIIDVRASRSCALAFAIAGLFACIPESVRWNVWQIETLTQWCVVMSASLASTTAAVIGLIGYLRFVYREVNEIEDSGPWFQSGSLPRLQFVQQWRERRQQRQEELQRQREEAEQKKAAKQKAREEGMAKRAEAKQKALEESEAKKAADKQEREEAAAQKRKQQEEERESRRQQKAAARAEQKASRQKPVQDSNEASKANESADEEESENAPKPKRGLGGWLKRKKSDNEDDVAASDSSDSDPPTTSEDEDSESVQPPSAARKQRKLSIGSLFGRKKSNANENSEEASDNDANEPNSDPPPSDDASSHEDSSTDPDDIDWNSLSKSEKRRMRKQMRRNRAA